MANTRKIVVIQSNKKTMKVAMITKSEDQWIKIKQYSDETSSLISGYITLHRQL